MENKIVKLDDSALDAISGGSIIFNGDHTTCGRNSNDQYAVLDYDGIISYVIENSNSMTEKTMIQNMLALGYIANL